MPVTVEERPRTVRAERYTSWTQSAQAVLTFVSDEQNSAPDHPLFVRGQDPTDTTVTAMLWRIHDGWYVPVRDGDWIVEGPNQSHDVLRPAEFDAKWKNLSLGVL